MENVTGTLDLHSKHSEIWACFTVVCVLPDANPTQMTPSKSRAATREAMSPFFFRGCELRLAASVSLFRRVKVLLWEGEQQVYLYLQKRKRKFALVLNDWKSGKVGTGLTRARTSPLLSLWLLAKILLCVFSDDSLRQVFIRASVFCDQKALRASRNPCILIM